MSTSNRLGSRAEYWSESCLLRMLLTGHSSASTAGPGIWVESKRAHMPHHMLPSATCVPFYNTLHDLRRVKLASAGTCMYFRKIATTEFINSSFALTSYTHFCRFCHKIATKSAAFASHNCNIKPHKQGLLLSKFLISVQ